MVGELNDFHSCWVVEEAGMLMVVSEVSSNCSVPKNIEQSVYERMSPRLVIRNDHSKSCRDCDGCGGFVNAVLISKAAMAA